MKSKKPKVQILREAPLVLKSSKSKVLPMSYLSYLEKTYVQSKYGLTDFLSVQKFTDMLLTSEDIKIYTIKYLREKLSGLNYADEGFLIYYNFPLQQEWLKTYSLRNLAVDTTYAVTKYRNKFTVFSILDEQERNIPVLKIISDREDSNIIAFCFSKFL